MFKKTPFWIIAVILSAVVLIPTLTLIILDKATNTIIIDCSTWVVYIGALLTCIGTLFLGAVAILQTREAQENSEIAIKMNFDNRRLSVLPSLGISELSDKNMTQELLKVTGYISNYYNNNDPFPQKEDKEGIEKSIYLTNVDSVYKFTSIRGMKDDIPRIDGSINNENNPESNPECKDQKFRRIRIKNIGNGTAISISFWYTYDGSKSENSGEIRLLEVNDFITIYILAKFSSPDTNDHDSLLTADYYDTYGNRYQKTFHFKVKNVPDHFIEIEPSTPDDLELISTNLDKEGL